MCLLFLFIKGSGRQIQDKEEGAWFFGRIGGSKSIRINEGLFVCLSTWVFVGRCFLSIDRPSKNNPLKCLVGFYLCFSFPVVSNDSSFVSQSLVENEKWDAWFLGLSRWAVRAFFWRLYNYRRAFLEIMFFYWVLKQMDLFSFEGQTFANSHVHKVFLGWKWLNESCSLDCIESCLN